jgi:hypothetical protein
MRSRDALFALLLILPASVVAQSRADSLPQARKFENVQWFVITQIKFKPGMRAKALGYWYTHQMKVEKAVGWAPTRILEHRFGEWDATIISSVPGGPGFFEWELSPQSAQFSAKAAEMAGGADKVKVMRDEYNSTIDHFVSSLSMERSTSSR